MVKVHAVIVTFHPDRVTLDALVNELGRQVHTVHVIDNTPPGESSGETFHAMPAIVHRMEGNVGVATGFNVGIRAAMAAGATHVLLSDQDSLPDMDMVERLMATEKECRGEGRPAAVVGPDFYNEVSEKSFRFEVPRRGWPIYRHGRPTVEQPVLDVAALISSGALMPLDILHDVGLLRDDLFIDFVDIEWCERARRLGYRCVADGRARMRHAMGEARLRLWLFGWRTVGRYGKTRLRYQARNATALLREPVDRRLKLGLLLFLLAKLYAYACFSDSRTEDLPALLAGIMDGICRRLGPLG